MQGHFHDATRDILIADGTVRIIGSRSMEADDIAVENVVFGAGSVTFDLCFYNRGFRRSSWYLYHNPTTDTLEGVAHLAGKHGEPMHLVRAPVNRTVHCPPEDLGFVAMMLLPSSGRQGFDRVQPSADKSDKAMIRRALEEESKLRLSADVQTELDALYRRIQREAASRAGFDDLDQGVDAIRSAVARHPDLGEIPIYNKFNRSSPGTLAVGDVVPATPVVGLDGQTFDLADHKGLIVTGSGS